MRLIPLQVDVRHPTMNKDEIERPITYHLIGDAEVTAARVSGLRRHAIRLGLARSYLRLASRFLMVLVTSDGVSAGSRTLKLDQEAAVGQGASGLLAHAGI